MGMGLGYVIWPLATRYLLSNLGWRGAFLIISGILLHGIPIGALLRPVPAAKRTYMQHEKSVKERILTILDLELFKNVNFNIYIIATFMVYAGMIIPYGFMFMNVTEYGIDHTSAALLMSIMGLTSLIGRLVYGWLGDRPWVNRLALQGTTSLLAGGFTTASYWANTYTLLLCYAGAFGVVVCE